MPSLSVRWGPRELLYGVAVFADDDRAVLFGPGARVGIGRAPPGAWYALETGFATTGPFFDANILIADRVGIGGFVSGLPERGFASLTLSSRFGGS